MSKNFNLDKLRKNTGLSEAEVDKLEVDVQNAISIIKFQTLILTDRIRTLAYDCYEDLTIEREKLEQASDPKRIHKEKRFSDKVIKQVEKLTKQTEGYHIHLCTSHNISQFLIAELTTLIETKSNNSIRSLKAGVRKYLRKGPIKDLEVYSIADVVILIFLIAGIERLIVRLLEYLEPIHKIHSINNIYTLKGYLQTIMPIKRATSGLIQTLLYDRGIKTIPYAAKDLQNRFIQYLKKSCDSNVIQECIKRVSVDTDKIKSILASN